MLEDGAFKMHKSNIEPRDRGTSERGYENLSSKLSNMELKNMKSNCNDKALCQESKLTSATPKQRLEVAKSKAGSTCSRVESCVK